MRHFDLPDQIIPQLELELQTLPEEKPQETLQIIEALWEDDHFESRDLAAFLLGRLPADYQGEAAARIKNWLEAPIDRAVVRSVLTKATVTLKSGTGAAWKTLPQQLLESPTRQFAGMGWLLWQAMPPGATSTNSPGSFALPAPSCSITMRTNRRTFLFSYAHWPRTARKRRLISFKQILSDTNTRVIERQFRQYLSCFPLNSRRASILPSKLTANERFNLFTAQ